MLNSYKRKNMKNRILLVLIATVLLGGGVATAGLSDWIYGESWKFMVEVGGITMGQPSRNPLSVYLPVRCDVSGLTEITKKPTTINSALSVKSIKTKIEEHKIYISVKAGLVSKDETCMCSSVDLGDIPAGNYEVIYYGSDREQHSLGSVIVPPK
jgi:hypothetical protein